MSTIEMISALKVGRIAICLDEQEYSYGVKIFDGNFYWVDDPTKKGEIFSLTSDALSYSWELEEEFVHVSDAIEAFVSGKKIYSFDSTGRLYNEYDPASKIGEIELREILEFFWSIERE